MITAPLPRASPLGSGRLSMIIPQNHGLTITYTCIIYIYIRDSQLNRPESVSLASLARQKVFD